ncbi:sugar-binding protein [Paenibacillus sp. GCM10023252]|uniref:sugar-binding protein n=1 Tax=Paenibacillus sp. GCM10023252 TaxID=3252649 RepID=UPI00360EA972
MYWKKNRKQKVAGFLAAAVTAAALLAPIGLGGAKTAWSAVTDPAVSGLHAAKKTLSSIVLDGNISEGGWQLGAKVLNNTVAGSTSNNTVTYDTLWDNDNLYVAVKVEDSVIVNNNHDLLLYEDDSIELFLDGDNAKSLTYDGNDYQIFIRAADNKVAVKKSNAPATLVPAITSAVSSTSSGYSVEVKIPWSSLGVTAKEGLYVGLDIANNDNDTPDGSAGRQATLTWNAKGNTNWGNPSTFGTLFLSGSKHTPIVSKEGTPSLDGQPNEPAWQLRHSLIYGNNTALFGSVSDSDYLYLGYVITDEQLHRDSGASMYDDDSIEIFIDGDNSKTAAYDSHDRHLKIGYGDNAVVEGASRSIAGVVGKTSQVAGGWAVEVAIPWVMLGITAKDRMSVGLDFTFNDDDNGGTRDSAGTWNGDGNNWRYTDKFGHLIVDNANVVKPAYTGPRETFTDSAVNLSLVYAKSPLITVGSWFNVGTQTTTPPSPYTKESRVYSNKSANEYVIYKSPSADMISFNIEELAQTKPWLELYVSSDDITYTKLAPGVQYRVTQLSPGVSTSGWYGKYSYTATSLPEGTQYLKVMFTNTNDYSSLLETVSFDYKQQYSGPTMSFTDEADDFTHTLAKSNMFVTNSRFDTSGKFEPNGLGAYVTYKSVSGHLLSFTMDTVEMAAQVSVNPAFELYESSDNITYTKVNLAVTTLVDGSSATGWYSKKQYRADRFRTGSIYMKISATATSNLWAGTIDKVSYQAVKVNTAPDSLQAVQHYITQDTVATGYIRGLDADHDPLTYRIKTPPQNGTSVVENAATDAWKYIPNAGYIGADIFEVEVTDGERSDTTKVTVITSYEPTNLTYYVNGVSGDDNGTGLSEDQAFKTIQKAADLTKPGDTVYIMNGTYLESSTHNEGVVKIQRSGLPGAYITYKAYPGHKPKLHVKTAWNHVLITASYIKLEGLEIEGNSNNISLEDAQAVYERLASGNITWGKETSAYSTNGIAVRPANANANYADKIIPTHVEIRNNYVHDVPGGGIYTDQADYLVIEGNKVHDTANRSAFANSGISVFHAMDTADYATDNEYQYIIRNNIAYRNETKVKWHISKNWSDGNGIIIDDFLNSQIKTHFPNSVPIAYTGRTLVENNIAYENGGSGIHSYNSNNVDIFNNTAYGNNVTPELDWGQIFAQTTTNGRVMNNIAVATDPMKRVNDNSGNKNTVYDYNIYYGGASTGVKVRGPHDRIIDPQFVDRNQYDFRLKTDSPAIDTGNPAVGSAKDYAGTDRPVGEGMDVGAYEFVPVRPNEAPAAPAGLAAANVTSNAFTLSWDPSSDDKGVTGYLVYSGDQLLSSVDGTSLHVTGLTPATVYDMTVVAYDAENSQSAASASLRVTTLEENTGGGTGEEPDYEVDGSTVITAPVLAADGSLKVSIPAGDLIEAVEHARTDHKVVTIEVPSHSTAQSVQVTIPAEGWTAARDSGIKQILIRNPFAHAAVALDAVQSYEDSIEVTIGKGQDALQAYTFYTCTIKVDGQDAADLDGKKYLQLSIPYELTDGEKGNKLSAYRIDQNGERLPVKNGKYDKQTASFVFYTNHTGRFVVDHE